MKRIIQAMVVAALFTGVQVQAEDGAIGLPSQWTNADRHAAEIALGGTFDAFPGASADPLGLPSMSTYADRFVNERNMQARGASDLALSE